MIESIAVTASLTAVQLPNIICKEVMIQNNGMADSLVYVGGPDISSLNGYKIAVTDLPKIIETENLNNIWILGNQNNINVRILYRR